MKTVTVKNITIGEGMPKICVPIVGNCQNNIIQEVQKAMVLPVDLIEWRADCYQYCADVQKVLQTLHDIRQLAIQTPILFTVRTAKEGGQKEFSANEYEQILTAVIESKLADMVDIELFTDEIVLHSLLKKSKIHDIKTILSSHDFEKTPEKQEIIKRLCDMQTLGGDISKMAVMPQNKKDVLTLLSATEEMQSQYADRPFVTMSMGNIGSVSRMLGEVFGSAITFGVGEQSSAPGQIEARKLKQMLEMVHDSIK